MKIRCTVLFFLFFLALLAGQNIDYTDYRNWAVYTAADQAEKSFDVFYIYPTLVADKNIPLMQWDRKTREKVIPFAQAQLSGLAPYANLYSPFVRQLEYYRCLAALKADQAADQTGMVQGIQDTVRAFRYYLTHLNRGRPYILLGHSQGALDLVMLLLMDRNIRTSRGFVAAYLIGIPLKKESAGFPLPFAKGERDIGVVITWNTQTAEAEESLFSGKGTYCINPLNWKTDSTPATAEQNPESMFYDYKTGEKTYRKNYCGAVIDPEKGALITDAPCGNEMGKGIHHRNDLYLFYRAMTENMRLRADEWYRNYGTAVTETENGKGKKD